MLRFFVVLIFSIGGKKDKVVGVFVGPQLSAFSDSIFHGIFRT